MTSIVVFIIFVVLQLIAGMCALLFSNLDKLGTDLPIAQPTPTAAGIALLIFEGLLAFGLWMWFYRFERSVRQKSVDHPELLGIFKFRPLKHDLEERPFKWHHLVSAICGVLLFALGLSGLLDTFHISDNGSTALFEGMLHNPWCILLLCLVGPVCEELVFRVGMVRSLYRHSVPGWMAITISAFAFAIVHGNLAQGIPAFLVGFILGLLYLRTGNLWLCLPAHIANNTLAVVLMNVGLDDTIAWWRAALMIFVSLPFIYNALMTDKSKS